MLGVVKLVTTLAIVLKQLRIDWQNRILNVCVGIISRISMVFGDALIVVSTCRMMKLNASYQDFMMMRRVRTGVSNASMDRRLLDGNKLGSFAQAELVEAMSAISSAAFLAVDPARISDGDNKYSAMVRCELGAFGDIRTLGAAMPLGIGFVATVTEFVTVAGDAIAEETEFSGVGKFSYLDRGKFTTVDAVYRFDGSGKINIAFMYSTIEQILCGPVLPD